MTYNESIRMSIDDIGHLIDKQEEEIDELKGRIEELEQDNASMVEQLENK